MITNVEDKRLKIKMLNFYKFSHLHYAKIAQKNEIRKNFINIK